MFLKVNQSQPETDNSNKDGRKGDVLFNDTLNTFYLRLYGKGPFR